MVKWVEESPDIEVEEPAAGENDHVPLEELTRSLGPIPQDVVDDVTSRYDNLRVKKGGNPFKRASILNTRTNPVVVLTIKYTDVRRLENISGNLGGGPASLSVGVAVKFAFEKGRVNQFSLPPNRPTKLPHDSEYVVVLARDGPQGEYKMILAMGIKNGQRLVVEDSDIPTPDLRNLIFRDSEK